MGLRSFIVSLLVLCSASVVAQSSATKNSTDHTTPYAYYGYAVWERRNVVESWDAEGKVGSYTIPVKVVKYDNGSHDINVESRIMQTGGNHIDIENCKYIEDNDGDKVRCDYTTYVFKREDISSWFNPAATYDYTYKDQSGSFTIKRS
jgi:hypothetical protein